MNDWTALISQLSHKSLLVLSIDIYLQKINENGTSYTQDSTHKQTEGQPEPHGIYIYI